MTQVLTRFKLKSGMVLLWLAIVIFGASSAITRKITELGADSLVDGRNPISLCNVLFVGNLCALLTLMPLFRRQWQPAILRTLTRSDWVWLVVVAILSGAVAPGLMFQALSLTNVNNVILVGRIEPPLILVLSVWWLKERIDRWQMAGIGLSFVGVMLTVFLQPIAERSTDMIGLPIGLGEILTACSALAAAASVMFSKQYLSHVSLGIYTICRNIVGTIVFFFTALWLYGREHFMDAFSPLLWQWMLLYGSIIVVLGQLLWLMGLRRSTTAEALLASSATPVLGILAAFLILGETPTLAQYLGGAVILLGISLSQVSSLRQAKGEQDAIMPQAGKLEANVGFKGI
jgi:drug/metabolite transporter (DMT)-like permease